MFREHSAFLSIDDKHRIKVGEPNFPVAAAERGRRVAVRINHLRWGIMILLNFRLYPLYAF